VFLDLGDGFLELMSIEEAQALFAAPADQLLSGEPIGLMGQLLTRAKGTRWPSVRSLRLLKLRNQTGA
jgi:hypothetical protein